MRSDVKSRESGANYAEASSAVNKTCGEMGSQPMPDFERAVALIFGPLQPSCSLMLDFDQVNQVVELMV